MGRYVCAVLVWSRGNFLQVASVQLFCICSDNSADNTGVFLLLLSRADTEPRLFCFSPHLGTKEAGDVQEAGRGHNQNSPSKLTIGKFRAL